MIDVLFTPKDNQRLQGLADVFGLTLDQVIDELAAHIMESGETLGTDNDENGEPKNGEPD